MERQIGKKEIIQLSIKQLYKFPADNQLKSDCPIFPNIGKCQNKNVLGETPTHANSLKCLKETSDKYEKYVWFDENQTLY